MAPLDVAAARTQLDAALRAAGTPDRADEEKRYLKSDLRHFGTSMPAIHRVTRAFSDAHPESTRADLRALVEELWDAGVHELRMTAVELMTLRSGLLEPEADVAWLEPRLARASGLTVREACKHLPEATREALLTARRAAAS